ncbi:MAG TPA: MopE-related protein, partial [Polyangiaceae bacterium]|nr:MopE-related protein [Polyangiaceae bacterium]
GTNCGTGACARTGSTSCVGGVTQDSCTPGNPAANDATCNNIDDDCDGAKDEDFGSSPTSCGTGACAATGTLTCVNGAPHDSCAPGAPAANDATCNNIDDDCDGAKDEDYGSTPTACGTGACAALGTLTCVNGTPHDSCSPGTPAGSDATCNNIDDDCDGTKDEDYSSVGTSCGFGACARTGSTSCVGGVVQDSCSPGAPLSLNDATCDGIDDDCDGIKDEDYVQTPTTCGAGACAAAGVLACINGSTHDTCVAGTQAPNDATCNGVDDDCDGTKDEDYVSVPTTCGVGACVAGGNSFCLGGSVQNGCTPGTPAANDATCDNTDDDCDGSKDEDFVQTPTTCGTGACGRTGHLVCNAGSVSDTCTPGAPAASDTTCDGIDDDCSGQNDEDYVPVGSNCGVGACASTGVTSCVSGVVQPNCTPGAPAPSDTSCNNTDDDCDGTKDEDFVQSGTTCGVGACASTGHMVCNTGSASDTCSPGTPAPNDASCNNIDDDCNGQKDEDYVSLGTSCGVGACARTGSTSCVGGNVQDSCAVGPTTGDDSDCDNVDDNCNGSKDENYVQTVTSCGVGACARNGDKVCVSGVVQDTCSPGAPAANDATCNNVDEDCSGQKDEDYVPVATACGVGACARAGVTSCVGGNVQDSCSIGPTTGDDSDCDNIDDNCDGSKDENYVPTPTTCGVGACASNGTLSCINGSTHNSCAPSIPSADDATCDNIDDNCNGAADEGYFPIVTNCGVGACASTGVTACNSGVESNSCVAGAALASDDTTCDGVDDDCDGSDDEDFVQTPTTCGIGACASTGNIECVGGSTDDTCSAGTPAVNDTTCDGVDDDCDGSNDEDYVPVSSSCGVGACTTTVFSSCVSGSVSVSCTPGSPIAVDDITCDGVDDNCNGSTDEDAVCPVDAGVDAGSDASTIDSGTMPNDGGNVSDASVADSGVVLDASAGGQGQGGALNDAGPAQPEAGAPSGGRAGSHSGAGGSGGAGAEDAAVAAAGKTHGSAGSAGAHQLDSGTDGVLRSQDSGSARGCSCELPGSAGGPTPLLVGLIPLIGLMIRRRRAAA